MSFPETSSSVRPAKNGDSASAFEPVGGDGAVIVQGQRRQGGKGAGPGQRRHPDVVHAVEAEVQRVKVFQVGRSREQIDAAIAEPVVPEIKFANVS